MRYATALAALAFWLFAAPASAPAQSSQEIQPKTPVLSIQVDHLMGDAGAKLVLVDFTDFQ